MKSRSELNQIHLNTSNVIKELTHNEMNEKKNRSERETKGNKLLIDGNVKRYLDHVNRLDDASREHTGGSAIDEGLHGGPDTNRGDFLLLRHLFFVFEGILRTRNEKKRFRRERERKR